MLFEYGYSGQKICCTIGQHFLYLNLISNKNMKKKNQVFKQTLFNKKNGFIAGKKPGEESTGLQTHL